MKFQIYDLKNKEFVHPDKEAETMMKHAGIDLRLRYDGLAMTEDGTFLVGETCGNWVEIDSSRFSITLDLEG